MIRVPIAASTDGAKVHRATQTDADLTKPKPNQLSLTLIQTEVLRLSKEQRI